MLAAQGAAPRLRTQLGFGWDMPMLPSRRTQGSAGGWRWGQRDPQHVQELHTSGACRVAWEGWLLASPCAFVCLFVAAAHGPGSAPNSGAHSATQQHPAWPTGGKCLSRPIHTCTGSEMRCTVAAVTHGVGGGLHLSCSRLYKGLGWGCTGTGGEKGGVALGVCRDCMGGVTWGAA